MPDLNPPATLEVRGDDIPVAFDRPLAFNLFKDAKDTRSFIEKNPGTLAVRRFHEGDEVCRLGEMGWTAFYILTTEEALELLQEVQQVGGDSLTGEIADLQQRKAEIDQRGSDADRQKLRAAMTVYLAGPPGPAHEKGRTDTMVEGELFGEMACLYGRPRAATIVANRTCYVLEMLRNILDKLQKKPAFRKQTDKSYINRVLGKHLRGLPVFTDLPAQEWEALLEKIKDRLELVSFKDGQLICDENESSDAAYLIRRGLVRVVKNVTSLLTPAEVRDWQALAAGLNGQPALPLEPEIRSLLARGALTKEEQQTVVAALNQQIRTLAPATQPALKTLVEAEAFHRRLRELPGRKHHCQELDQRRLNRLLLETICPGALVSRLEQAGPECILAYRAEGEFIGEMGLMLERPRSATCIAYVHPPTQGDVKDRDRWLSEMRVELVRIPGEVFRELVESSPAVRKKLEAVVAQREKHTTESLKRRAWSAPSDVLRSERFQQLGLIQGQKLMLIDLDRCTRCDECVQACVHTHSDGRTRLFLDGPRFDRFLVPTTCRSCLDPVCTIGCPVAAIHRGNDLQIIIENNCIGCGMCADNCPYGSIQMHDEGLVPRGTHGWRYHPAEGLADGWQRPGYRDRRWPVGRTPFRLDRELMEVVKEGAPAVLCFRHEFEVPRSVLRSAGGFEMTVQSSQEASVTVWLNGVEVSPAREAKKSGNREYEIAADSRLLRIGRNVVAVRVSMSSKPRQMVLDLRLGVVPPPLQLPGKTVLDPIKAIEDRAVVCDLCDGKEPACVAACPHDAAMRVDARFEFPTSRL